MRLADDGIVVTVGEFSVRLKPSLRAALRLCRRTGGLSKLSMELQSGSVSAMTDVIRIAAGDDAAARFAAELGKTPLRTVVDFDVLFGLDTVAEPISYTIIRYVASLYPEPEKPQVEHPTGGTVTLVEDLERQFRVGTGWLGWTPEQTWSATSHEIIEAYKGRVEMLQAIFGTPEKGDDASPPEPHWERDPEASTVLRSLVTSGANKAK